MLRFYVIQMMNRGDEHGQLPSKDVKLNKTDFAQQ